ncbi:molecular chaperone [Planoprotostelium fungivorum]|uniref:Molecular chaperone n=1 Tax=Planoprotostelium fungivorum TaxID=1890364 RepID=A0A2P6NI22_9EUKA|nr:molecular chaperone [Planoprotostelium fungivorum]
MAVYLPSSVTSVWLLKRGRKDMMSDAKERRSRQDFNVSLRGDVNMLGGSQESFHSISFAMRLLYDIYLLEERSRCDFPRERTIPECSHDVPDDFPETLYFLRTSSWHTKTKITALEPPFHHFHTNQPNTSSRTTSTIIMPKEESKSMTPFQPESVLDYLGNEIFSPFRSSRLGIQRTDNGYLIEAEMAGVPKENVSVEVKDSILHISGKQKMEEEKDGRKMCSRSDFYQSVRLPKDADHESVKAVYADGLLKVCMNRFEERDSTKKITIQ